MNWLAQIDTELARLRPDDTPGRVRTTARRIAGIALQQLASAAAGDMIGLLRTAATEPSYPEEVRTASERLSARLDAEFRSPSTDPLSDARCIVRFVQDRLLPR